MDYNICGASDPELMDQIKKSEKDVKEGKVSKWDAFVKDIFRI